MNGSDFAKKYPERVFLKLTSSEEIHYGQSYTTGVIVGNSMSFTDDEHVHLWMNCRIDLKWFRPVLVLDDSVIFEESVGCYYADKFELLERYPISSFPDEIVAKSVVLHGDTIRFISNQTDFLCRAALKVSPYSIEFIRNQKKEYCLIALEKDIWTWTQIREMDSELWSYILKVNGKMIEYCDEPSRENCHLAIKKDLSNLSLFYKRAHQFTLDLLAEAGVLLQYIDPDDRTHDMCKIAVSSMSCALKYVPDRITRYSELVEIAERKNGHH